MIWKTILTIQAKTMLEDIQDRRVQEKIRDRINGLVDEPEKQGKLLTGELTVTGASVPWGSATGSSTAWKKIGFLS